MTYFLRKSIINFQYLTHVNLSNNEIIKLPKDFGTLSSLQWLNLSHNRLGTPGQYKWLWLEQFPIQKSLIVLNMSYNSLKELPICITKLRALKGLNISHNKLERLPQCTANLKNLTVLDVSYNCLLYLPLNIYSLYAHIRLMNVSMNPFISIDLHYSVGEYNKVPSVVELSANTVLNHRIEYDINSLPNTLIMYLDTAKECLNCNERVWCNKFCKIMQMYSTISNYNTRYRKIIFDTESECIKLEILFCLSCCNNALLSLGHPLKNSNPFKNQKINIASSNALFT